MCKEFFLKTIDVGEKAVDFALKKIVLGVYDGDDTRGKHKPHNKISEEDEALIKDHIASFPNVESHYTRKDTKRMYLAQDLSIRQMQSRRAKCC